MNSRLKVVTNIVKSCSFKSTGNQPVIHPSAGSLTGLFSHAWNPFVNAAQENSEKKGRKRVMLAILVARMGVDGWVKGKRRFQSDEEAHALLQFYGAGLLTFSQAMDKKCHIINHSWI